MSRDETGPAVRWRPMTAGDLAAVKTIADFIHVNHPEEMPVFAERLALYPEGCHVAEAGARLVGYALSHPWRYGEPPPLDTPLGAIPEGATTFYLHDVALLPEGRGKGLAGTIVDHLADHAAAAGFDNLSLVAVNGSQGFWEKCGFRTAMTAALRAKLATYGSDALLMRRDVPDLRR
ncbi:GNAT family N-acetyltransferase [Microvirga sp. 17 mud 1-3]|uniref:GNAT family N-acetyltransferase n=1 Tax=Microvirga sp. 17 mud 1-3 TaxID=2082949 RepID=UPI000D6CCB12|nr:GNAT family N-acetyltransferase [Microvirga sp. 17 mud 1-3]AWM86459.1 GNAT family N-acetyltransferase [Microvirga sp. 17 mud 1-3]